ncbi:MAG: YceI family protein [Actinomycetota bacterium]|nr:YceI family protein [Actinomycetota bacterium]
MPLANGTWVADPSHSSVEFVVRHLGLSKVRGRFHEYTMALEVHDSLAESSVIATIDLASIDTGDADRDEHLRSIDFFDVANEPTMTFASTSIAVDDGAYQLLGDLALNDITRAVAIDVEFHGTEVSPVDSRVRAGFSGYAEICRSDFGIEFDVPLHSGRLMLGEHVAIELEMQLHRS